MFLTFGTSCVVNWPIIIDQYNASNVNIYAPNAPGIYLIYTKLKNGTWKPIYVGQSISIEQRLLDHLSNSEPNQCIKENVGNYICGFQFTQITDAGTRDGVEKYLYDTYQPSCNRIDPGGIPISVNLPFS